MLRLLTTKWLKTSSKSSIGNVLLPKTSNLPFGHAGRLTFSYKKWPSKSWITRIEGVNSTTGTQALIHTMPPHVPRVSTVALSTSALLKPMFKTNGGDDSFSSNLVVNWLAVAAAGLAINAFDSEPNFAETVGKRKRTNNTKATTNPRYVLIHCYFRLVFIVYSKNQYFFYYSVLYFCHL